MKHVCYIDYKRGNWLCKCGRRPLSWEEALSVALNIISDRSWAGGQRPCRYRGFGGNPRLGTEHWSIFWDRPTKRLKLYKGWLKLKMGRNVGTFVTKPNPFQREIAELMMYLTRICPPEGPKTKYGFGDQEWQEWQRKEHAKNN